MSKNIPSGVNRSEADNSNDSFDREQNSWMLNLLLNIKSQKDIAQDIADGVFEMVEIEKMFPIDYVQKLRAKNYESTQNYLNRFKHMTGERIKGVLNTILKKNNQKKLFDEIADRFVNFGSAKLSNIANNLKENIKNMNSQSTSNNSSMIPDDLKSGNVLGTKKKRITKKNPNVVPNKKDEKPKNIREITKKIINIRLTKNKLSVNVDDGNKVEEAITETASLTVNQKDDENTSTDLIDFSTSISREGSKESSFDDKEKEKGLPKEAKPMGIKKPVKKNKTDGTKKKTGPRKSSVPIKSTSSKIDDKMEEVEKSQIINENARNDEKEESNDCPAYLIPEARHNLSLEKSSLNEATNNSNSMNGDKEICCNQNKEIPNVQKYTEVDTSTPKKLNTENDIIKVKEEPVEPNSNESNFYEFNYFTDEKKTNLSTDKSNEYANSNATPMKAKVEQSKNIQRKIELDKNIKTSNFQRENLNQEVKKCKNKIIPIVENIKKMQNSISTIQNNLDAFNNQMTKLNQMNEEEESSDSSTDYDSEERSSTSSSTESSLDSLSESYSDSSRGCDCTSSVDESGKSYCCSSTTYICPYCHCEDEDS